MKEPALFLGNFLVEIYSNAGSIKFDACTFDETRSYPVRPCFSGWFQTPGNGPVGYQGILYDPTPTPGPSAVPNATTDGVDWFQWTGDSWASTIVDIWEYPSDGAATDENGIQDACYVEYPSPVNKIVGYVGAAFGILVGCAFCCIPHCTRMYWYCSMLWRRRRT